ncbi:MAG: type II secretion system protein J, partial [Acidobacteriota bacterium]
MLIPRGWFRVRLSLRHHSRHARQGFTLVEMLVVAPIIIVVITGLVAAMVAMVGDALTANSRAVTAYDTQDALERIEQDVRTTANFMGTFNYLTAPQGRDGNVGAFNFSTNKDLILTQQATTGSPYDSNRTLVYYTDQPAGCSEDLSTNNILSTRTIYFLRNGSLWRRSIVDAWNNNSVTDSDTVCGKPWQRDSCPNITGVTLGAAPAATCNTYDEELLKNVTAFTPTFYNSNNVNTPNPLSASAVKVVVTTSKVVGGETITQTSTIHAVRRNDIPTDTSVPSTPVFSQYNAGIDIYHNPTTVSFQWTSSGATSYRVQTSSDGGTTWSEPFLTSNNWASVKGIAYSGMPGRVRVTAYNSAGASTQATSGQLS